MNRAATFLLCLWLSLAPALASSILPFPAPVATVPAAATVTFTANAQQTGATTTCTFTSQAIGTAAANRIIIVGASIYQNPAVNINSVTVGGISATSQVAVIAGTFIKVQLWTAAVPTGTTANVVVTYSSTTGRCAIGVWAAYNLLSATATGTNTSTSNPATPTVSVSAGGIVVGYTAMTGGSTPTFTWSGITEDFDATADPAVTEGHSGASLAFASAGSVSVSATPSSFTFGGAVSAAFR